MKAIIIGNSEYDIQETGFKNLPQAFNDAKEVKDICTEQLNFKDQDA